MYAMEWISYIVASLFVLLGLACLVLVVLQLPGGWIMYALAIVIELIDTWYLSGGNPWTFEVFGISAWWILGAGLALLLIGELIEFLGSMLGARGGGASRSGSWGALVGGVLGAFVLAVPFSIIPGIGTIFGVLLGAIVGSFLGALIAELGIARNTVRGSVKPAVGAAIGRIAGTTGKLAVTIVLWVLLSVAVFLA